MILHCKADTLNVLTPEAQAIVRAMMADGRHSQDVTLPAVDTDHTAGLRWSWQSIGQGMVMIACDALFALPAFADDLTSEECFALADAYSHGMWADASEARKVARECIAEEEHIAACEAAECNRFGNGWKGNEDI